MFRVLLAAAVALLPLQVADAQTCRWQNGRWTCSTSAPVQAATVVESAPVTSYTTSSRYQAVTVKKPVYGLLGRHRGYRYETQYQPVQSAGSSGYTASYGSAGGSPSYTEVRTAAEPAAVSVDAPKAGSAGCDCGCQERIEGLEKRVQALEMSPFRTSHNGPPVSCSRHSGPAVVLGRHRGPSVAISSPSQPAYTVAMR